MSVAVITVRCLVYKLFIAQIALERQISLFSSFMCFHVKFEFMLFKESPPTYCACTTFHTCMSLQVSAEVSMALKLFPTNL